jgi:hypothetical protein
VFPSCWTTSILLKEFCTYIYVDHYISESYKGIYPDDKNQQNQILITWKRRHRTLKWILAIQDVF